MSEGGKVKAITHSPFLAGPEHRTHRREALKLVMATSSAVLSLRSPLESTLPGRSIDKFTAMLFGSEVGHYILVQTLHTGCSPQQLEG